MLHMGTQKNNRRWRTSLGGFGLLIGLPMAMGLAAERVGPAQPPARPTAQTENCLNECHSQVVDHKVMHGPAAQGSCLMCHDYLDPASHTFTLKVDQQDLCLQCHDQGHERVKHAPVEEGLCMECHDPHGSDHQMMLRLNPERDLCVQCHTDVTKGAKFVHGPVISGACIICHEPHGSNEPKLLVEQSTKLCTSCHDEIETQNEVGLHVHTALEQGCTGCHSGHATDHQFQLVQEPPDLCLTCHDYMKDTIDNAATVHGPLQEGQSCTLCHNSHSSRLPNLQRLEQPDLCLECHDKTIEVGEDRVLTNMAELLKNNPNHHGPIREGMCTACHQPHGGDHFSLLLEEYPPEFYAAFDIEKFALCFSCHIPDLVLDESGTGLTQFRDGDRNLHWLHVNREKGRTCRACHEVHASKRPAHVRDAVPFGKAGWLLEIKYKQSDQGGSCAPACHKTKVYDRFRIPSEGDIEGGS